MADLTKPQYHNPKKYPADRQIYQTRPARTDFTRPSGIPDQMSTVSKVLDTIQDSLGIYQELYTQSEKTANTLQAKGLLVKKMKDTQRIRELLATQLPLTPPENLKLQDVLNNYKDKDKDGRTNFNIGDQLQHNITPLELPDNLPDHVKNLVFDDWVRMEVGLVNSIMEQVEQVQSAQTQSMLELVKSDFAQKYGTDTRVQVGETWQQRQRKRRDLLENHLERIFGEIESLGNIGTWTPHRIREEKQKVIQTALATEFQTDRLRNKKDAVRRANNNLYKYELDNRTIYLSRNVIDPFQESVINRNAAEKLTEIERVERDEALKTWETYKSQDPEKLLSPLISIGINRTGEAGAPVSRTIDTSKWMDIVKRARGSIPSKYVSDAEMIRFAYKIKLQHEGNLDTEQQKDLNNIMAEIALEIDRDPKAISKYTDVVDGKRKAKSNTELRSPKITGNDFFDNSFITQILRGKEEEKARNAKVFKDAMNKAGQIEIINYLESQYKSNSGEFLLKYGDYKLGADGKMHWEMNDEKIDKDADLGKYMWKEIYQLGDKRGRITNIGTKEQQLSIKKVALFRSWQNAIKVHEDQLAKEEQEVLSDTAFNGSYIPSIIQEWQISLKERVLAATEGVVPSERETRRMELKNKKLNSGQKAEEQRLDYHAEKITKIAEEVNNWSLTELRSHIKGLKKGDMNAGVSYTDDNYSGLSEMAQGILSARIKDLTNNTAYLQLKESSPHNRAILEGGEGQYNLEDIADWQRKHGVTNPNNLIPKATLAEIKILEDPITDIPTKIAILDKFTVLESKYGNASRLAHRQISLNMRAQVNGGMRGVFEIWATLLPLNQRPHLEGALLEISRQTAEERTRP